MPGFIDQLFGTDVSRGAVTATISIGALLVSLASFLIGLLTNKRKNAREDRSAALAALRRARRFQAPLDYYDMDDALEELRYALFSFPKLVGHFVLLSKTTRALWRDSRADWSEKGGKGQLFAGSYSADLVEIRDDVAERLAKRILAGRFAAWKGRAKELVALTGKVDKAVPEKFTQRPDRTRVAFDPATVLDEVGRHRYYMEGIERTQVDG